jgi:hypothetical protein
MGAAKVAVQPVISDAGIFGEKELLFRFPFEVASRIPHHPFPITCPTHHCSLITHHFLA